MKRIVLAAAFIAASTGAILAQQTSICGMDGKCTVYPDPGGGALDGTTGSVIFGTGTLTEIKPPQPGELDFVKAGAVIRWHSRKEDGMVRRAMERAADIMDTCARQETYLTISPSINCK